MNEIKPMFFTKLKGYTKEQLIKDIISGIIVAIIALPLSIALALASGVGPEQGIYTAIIAGFLISFFGGSAVQIAGPTAAFATIVAGIVATAGMNGLIVATIVAGIMLILMGVFKLGKLIKFIPYTITTGFTAGIAVTIVVGQLKDFFGVTYPDGVKPIETMEKLEYFFKGIKTANASAIVVGVVCFAILMIWPMLSRFIKHDMVDKITKTVPASIIAILIAIIMVKGGKMGVNTIGDLYTISNSLPKFSVSGISFDLIVEMLPNAFTIAILAAIESLLSAVVADGMIGEKHRSNAELVAQGIGNIGSVMFGGIPATGAIARTAANIKSGGRTPVAGMVHSGTLVLILVVLMPFAAWIPMPCIAAILFKVALDMCQYKNFAMLLKVAPKSDIIVLVVTFVLTVVFDLVVAIEWGMIIACVLFIKRMSEESRVMGWTYSDSTDPKHISKEIRVYEINGPLFFGVADHIADIKVSEDTKVLILHMRAVPAVDGTAMKPMEELLAKCKEMGITLMLSHLNEQPRKMMEHGGFIDRVGKENIIVNVNEAIDAAEEIVRTSAAQ